MESANPEQTKRREIHGHYSSLLDFVFSLYLNSGTYWHFILSRMDMPMNTTSTPMDRMMQMSFYWGTNAIVLFPGWPKESVGMYALAFLFVFFLAFAVEVLANYPTTSQTKPPMVYVFAQSIVYALRMGLAYLVMLSVMSFNGGIFIAAVAGHATGFCLVRTRALLLKGQTDHP